LSNKTYIALDLETTGLDSQKHGIIQIGAWATGESEDHFKDYFVTDCDPSYFGGKFKKVQFDEGARKVNGFTDERIADAPDIDVALRAFNNFLQKYRQDGPTGQLNDVVIVGQNVPFDVAWLIKDFRRFGLNTDVFRRVVDNASLGFAVFGELMGQGKLADKFGIKNGGAHDALSDAMTASKVFHRLRKRLPRPKDFTMVPRLYWPYL
jgi:DNA polymerase III alpha subunit (gram-positive type)